MRELLTRMLRGHYITILLSIGSPFLITFNLDASGVVATKRCILGKLCTWSQKQQQKAKVIYRDWGILLTRREQ